MLQVEDFLRKASVKPVVDVRSPAEYAAGHIPGAFNIPLFDDEERIVVGTLYKNAGREVSILRGLDFVGPKLSGFIKKLKALGLDQEILMHCWRGGMRSENMAWLFRLVGYQVDLLDGGYKAYRSFIRAKLGDFNNIVILGGKTGSGKTDVLEHLNQKGYQVLNLEQIAHHKGSAFGDLGQKEQPNSEQFENNLFQKVDELDSENITFVEDESRGIGKLSLPDTFYNVMRISDVVFLDVPKGERVKRLVDEYADFPNEQLAAAVRRIGKKLGGQNVTMAIEALDRDDFNTVADILLYYYDKAYLKGLSIRDQATVYKLDVETDDAELNAGLVLNFYREKLVQDR